jgi:hypothetical protein
MGWWNSRAGMIGDGPVDLIEQCMAAWPDAGRSPTWQQLVDAVGLALQRDGGHWVSDPGAVAGGVGARFSGNAAELRADPAAAREMHVEALAQAFAEVAAEYEETQARRPTSSELLGTLAFSLRSQPERFLRPEDDRQLEDFQLRGSGERA